MTLGEYLKWALAEPWGWGANHGLDCCKFAGKWAICCGYVDPMVVIWSRADRQYDSEKSALRTISRGGGLLTLWQEGMMHVGMAEADSPEAGDIGILEAEQEDGGREACGIFTGERWAMLGQRGLIFARPDVLGLWRP